MTSGNYQLGSRYSPSYFGRIWTGGDGKFETYNGRVRDKWNNYDCRVYNSSATPGSLGTYTLSGGSYPAAIWTDIDRLALRAQSKLVEKVTANAPNLVVDAFQGHQTLTMVYQALASFGRSALALRHGDFVKAARALGVNPKASKLRPSDVAGRWLELQYGWLPTIADIHAAMTLWESRQNPEARKLIFKSRAVEVKYYETSASPTLYSIKGPTKIRYQIEAELSEEYPLGRSLGLADPLSLAWELLPWSFVVDWFYPIGTYLEALNAIPKLKGRFLVTKSFKFVGRSKLTDSGKKIPAYVGASYFEQSTQMKRTLSTTLKTGSPQFVPLSGALSPLRFKNAVALATQCFSSSEVNLNRRGKPKKVSSVKGFAPSWDVIPDWDL